MAKKRPAPVNGDDVAPEPEPARPQTYIKVSARMQRQIKIIAEYENETIQDWVERNFGPPTRQRFREVLDLLGNELGEDE